MRQNLLLFCLLALATLACQKFEDLNGLNDFEYNAEYAIPLLEAEFALSDVLDRFEEEASLLVQPDGGLLFKYRGDVLSTTADEVFSEINSALDAIPIIPLLEEETALPFAIPGGIDLDKMDLKAGNLSYLVQNGNPFPVNVTIRMPQVTAGMDTVRFDVMVPAGESPDDPANATNYFAPLDLNGYTVLPSQDSIYVTYEAFDLEGNEVDVFAAVTLSDLKFSYAEGFLGQQLHEGGRDTIDIDFFDTWIQGEVYFSDPIIRLYFENSFGMPTQSIVNNFDIFTVRSEVLPLESDFVTNGVAFPYPTINEVNVVKYDTFEFNKNNSNIDDVLGAGPLAIDYSVDAITNIDNDPNIRGFITCESYYKVQVEVELPLEGSAQDFITFDTFDVNLSEYEEIDFAEFKIVSENELPLNIDLQGYFLRADGSVIDSLFTEETRAIAGAPVDGAGNVTSSGLQTTFAMIEGATLKQVQTEANRIALRANFSTTDGIDVPVKALAAQKARVRMGVKLGVNNE